MSSIIIPIKLACRPVTSARKAGRRRLDKAKAKRLPRAGQPRSTLPNIVRAVARPQRHGPLRFLSRPLGRSQPRQTPVLKTPTRVSNEARCALAFFVAGSWLVSRVRCAARSLVRFVCLLASRLITQHTNTQRQRRAVCASCALAHENELSVRFARPLSHPPLWGWFGLGRIRRGRLI